MTLAVAEALSNVKPMLNYFPYNATRVCFRNQPKGLFRVRVGDWDQGERDGHEQELAVEEILIHPRYSREYRGSMSAPACLPGFSLVYRVVGNNNNMKKHTTVYKE